MDMLSLLAVVEEVEKSKAAFYITGGLLVAWAVVLSAAGLTRPSFPGSATAARGVMGISAALVLSTLVAIVATS